MVLGGVAMLRKKDAAFSATASSAAPQTDGCANSDVRGIHLLLAEDNELSAEMIKMLLEDRGAAVEVAQNGRKALEMFENHAPGTYAVILMDMMMPELDGIGATRAIRALAREDARTIPILAMTANEREEDARRCFEAGMNAHLCKPIRIEELAASIVRLCKKA